MKEVGFGLTEMAWNGGSQFLPDWTDFEWRKLVFARLEWLEMEQVGFDLSSLERRKSVLASLERRKLFLA
jgi:hypothetical protein